MNRDLSHYRKTYDKRELLIDDVPGNPLQLFQEWFKEMDEGFPDEEANAMTLTTIGTDGFPKGRVVLLKQLTAEGFIFYTNYESEKGQSILAEPHVGLSFFWQKLERQVIIKGIAKKVTSDVSDAYFTSRPRGSQLGALVSHQSSVVSKYELEQKLVDVEVALEGKTIERPDYWGGFIIEPVTYEFWQGRPNRLHDRLVYKKGEKNTWTIDRLSP
ncbi:pyridoxamine 5'-phosphate oxidase [Lacinutrix undariae]